MTNKSLNEKDCQWRPIRTTTDIITRLIGYAEHDADCAKSKMNSNIIPCTCGYSAAIADAREFLEGESNDE